MNNFYTKTGDKGKSVIGKNKIEKDNFILDTLGELDELNSLCGLVGAIIKNRKIKDILPEIQENLFIIQANIAKNLFYSKKNNKYKEIKIKDEKIFELEKIIDYFGKKIKPIKNFIIPGSNIESAWIDFLRATTRRIERKIIKLNRTKKIDKNSLMYINRASSLLFVLARYAACKKGVREKNPRYL